MTNSFEAGSMNSISSKGASRLTEIEISDEIQKIIRMHTSSEGWASPVINHHAIGEKVRALLAQNGR